MNDLEKEYAKICNSYRELLCIMFKFGLSDSFWVGGDASLLMAGDYCINFDDVRFIVDNRVTWDDFSSWYEYTTRIKSIDIEIPTPNLKNWCSGCPRYSQEAIIELEALHDKLRIKKYSVMQLKN